jgi:hypothetical protein
MWRYALEEPRATCLLGEYTRAWRVAARRNIRTFSPVWLGRRNFEHRAFLPGSHVTSRYNSGTHGCNLPESCFTMSMNGLPNPGSAAKLLVCQRSRAPKVVVARTVPNSAVDQLFFSAVLPLIDLYSCTNSYRSYGPTYNRHRREKKLHSPHHLLLCRHRFAGIAQHTTRRRLSACTYTHGAGIPIIAQAAQAISERKRKNARLRHHVTARRLQR